MSFKNNILWFPYDIHIQINLGHLHYVVSFKEYGFRGFFSKNIFYFMDLTILVYSRSRCRSRDQSILQSDMK